MIKHFFATLFAVGLAGSAACVTNDSLPVYRNEIGLNLAPVIAVTVGGSPGFENRFAFVYKRALDRSRAFRLMPSLSLYSQDMADMNDYDVVVMTDSSETRKYRKWNNDPKLQVNMGVEYRWGKRKVKWFAGADLFYSYRTYGYDEYFQSYKWDTVNGSYQFTAVLNDSSGAYPHYSFHRSSSVHAAGLSPFIGLSIPLSAHFALAANFAYNISFGFGKSTEQENGGWLREYNFTSFDVESTGAISDVSLIYRF